MLGVGFRVFRAIAEDFHVQNPGDFESDCRWDYGRQKDFITPVATGHRPLRYFLYYGLLVDLDGVSGTAFDIRLYFIFLA